MGFLLLRRLSVFFHIESLSDQFQSKTLDIGWCFILLLKDSVHNFGSASKTLSVCGKLFSSLPMTLNLAWLGHSWIKCFEIVVWSSTVAMKSNLLKKKTRCPRCKLHFCVVPARRELNENVSIFVIAFSVLAYLLYLKPVDQFCLLVYLWSVLCRSDRLCAH